MFENEAERQEMLAMYGWARNKAPVTLAGAIPSNVEFHLTRNEHQGYCLGVRDHLASEDRHFEHDLTENFLSAEDRELACQTDELWTLQVYPRGSTSFHLFYGSSLATVLEKAAKEMG